LNADERALCVEMLGAVGLEMTENENG